MKETTLENLSTLNIEMKKVVVKRCQDCDHYRKPKCKISGDFTARKSKCDKFLKK